MTADAAIRWLAAMKAAGRAKTDADCAAQLGVTPAGILKMKKAGTTRSTALAMAALLHGLEPYE